MYSEKWRGLFLLVFIALVGLAGCNEHALNPFGSALRVGSVEPSEQGDVRTVDILFVVDNSNSMCEEQKRLQENFDAFIQILESVNAEFQIAVVNTDMVSLTDGSGQLRTGPGSYVENAGQCSEALPDTSFCDGRTLGPILKKETYAPSGGEWNLTQLQEDFSCLALTGIDGSKTEMGLGSMRQALETAGEEFFRPGSILAVVFVTDENDCSDGTVGFDYGPVLEKGGGDRTCEINRNLEDSCLYALGDRWETDAQGESTKVLELGPEITIGEETKYAREWCVEGDRKAIESIQGELDLKCESNGCVSGLVPRSDYYDFLIDLVKTRNGYEDDESAINDIIIATIINEDGGIRYNVADPFSDQYCGSAGTQGYRYQAFAEMFSEDRRVVASICDQDTGNPTAFAEPLQLIGEVIGSALNTICLKAPPMQCDPDGLKDDGTCKAGMRCCPVGQTCLADAYLAGSNLEYHVCSGFEVRVEIEDKDTEALTQYVQGEDFLVNFESRTCIGQSGSPVEISLLTTPPAESTIVVSYPREVGSVFE